MDKWEISLRSYFSLHVLLVSYGIKIASWINNTFPFYLRLVKCSRLKAFKTSAWNNSALINAAYSVFVHLLKTAHLCTSKTSIIHLF